MSSGTLSTCDAVTVGSRLSGITTAYMLRNRLLCRAVERPSGLLTCTRMATASGLRSSRLDRRRLRLLSPDFAGASQGGQTGARYTEGSHEPTMRAPHNATTPGNTCPSADEWCTCGAVTHAGPDGIAPWSGFLGGSVETRSGFCGVWHVALPVGSGGRRRLVGATAGRGCD